MPSGGGGRLEDSSFVAVLGQRFSRARANELITAVGQNLTAPLQHHCVSYLKNVCHCGVKLEADQTEPLKDSSVSPRRAENFFFIFCLIKIKEMLFKYTSVWVTLCFN